MLAELDPAEGAPVAARGAAAMSERGQGFAIGCSHGVAHLPRDATTTRDALNLADQRMYERKAGRASASRQSADVLPKALTERDPGLGEHISVVGHLALLTAQSLGLDEHEVNRIECAGELHDIGKVAMPDTILNKPGPLDPEEWAFMRRHTLMGERMIAAAPAAELVRWSHERHDGGGYPDGLAGEAIPLGASIIAVCDAFDAMTSTRPYRAAGSVADALAELRRCAGSQFHPDAVNAFCGVIERPESGPRRPARRAGQPVERVMEAPEARLWHRDAA